MDANKQKALTAALGQIERQFGKGTVMRMGDTEPGAIPSISTGSLGLDIALGIGGLPRGRVVEVYGPESSGKTTLTLQVIAEAQKAGGTAAFIDAEHALDPLYAEKLGVRIDDLIVSQPDTGEQALEVTEMLVRSGAVDVLVIDSVAALTPKAEIEGEMGDSHVGLQARLLSQAMRKLTATIKQTNSMVIFINQIRMKIGVMFGSPETTTGGNALKFYSSVRLDIRRIGAIKEGDEVVGNETRVKVVKNKVSPPFKQAEFQIMYGKGIYRMGEVIDLGVKLNFLEKSGAWYAYNGEKIGQGKANAARYLEENPAVAEKVESQIRAQLLKPQGTREAQGREPQAREDQAAGAQAAAGQAAGAQAPAPVNSPVNSPVNADAVAAGGTGTNPGASADAGSAGTGANGAAPSGTGNGIGGNGAAPPRRAAPKTRAPRARAARAAPRRAIPPKAAPSAAAGAPPN